MLSQRLPQDLAPNPWAHRLEQRRARGEPLLDLISSDPTHAGLVDAAGALAALADPRAARHEPEACGLRSARQVVAASFSVPDAATSPEDVVLTASTSEAYAHLFRLLADPGETVLAPAPSYPLLEPLAALEGVRLESYRLRFEGRWRLDLDHLRAAVDRARSPRAVVVVQPNHPTGSCLSASEVDALEELCQQRGLALIADEVFGEFPRPGICAPLPTMLGSRRVPTFVLGGLSKSCGLPQLKLAWILLAGPEAARRRARAGLEWIADAFLSVSSPVQHALPGLLAGRGAFQARLRERLESNLAALAAASSGGDVELLPADGGWSAVLRLPALHTSEEWALRLLERDVVAYPGDLFDFEDDAWLVVSLLAEPAALAEGAARLVTAVREELVHA
jgi:alanine-synthesizing transaminase